MDACAAKGINAKVEPRTADDLHFNYVAKIGELGGEIVWLVRCRGTQSLLMGSSFHAGEAGFEQLIRLGLDPIGGDLVRRTAIGGIIFEATVMRRIMRRGDDNSVREPDFPAAIVSQDRVRNHRRRSVFFLFCKHHLDAICRQHLERGRAGRNGKRMSVDAEIQWTVSILLLAIQTDGLGDGENVPFVESPLEGRPTVPRSDKGHALGRHGSLGDIGVAGGDEPRHIDEYFNWRGLSCQGTYIHSVLVDPASGSLFAFTVLFHFIFLSGSFPFSSRRCWLNS